MQHGEQIMEGFQFDLQKPIKAHGEELTQLNLRAMGGRDVRELGVPFYIRGDDGYVPLPDIGAKYISRLAGIPMSSVDQMGPSDLFQLTAMLVPFFMPKESTSPD